MTGIVVHSSVGRESWPLPEGKENRRLNEFLDLPFEFEGHPFSLRSYLYHCSNEFKKRHISILLKGGALGVFLNEIPRELEQVPDIDVQLHSKAGFPSRWEEVNEVLWETAFKVANVAKRNFPEPKVLPDTMTMYSLPLSYRGKRRPLQVVFVHPLLNDCFSTYDARCVRLVFGKNMLAWGSLEMAGKYPLYRSIELSAKHQFDVHSAEWVVNCREGGLRYLLLLTAGLTPFSMEVEKWVLTKELHNDVLRSLDDVLANHYPYIPEKKVLYLLNFILWLKEHKTEEKLQKLLFDKLSGELKCPVSEEPLVWSLVRFYLAVVKPSGFFIRPSFCEGVGEWILKENLPLNDLFVSRIVDLFPRSAPQEPLQKFLRKEARNQGLIKDQPAPVTETAKASLEQKLEAWLGNRQFEKALAQFSKFSFEEKSKLWRKVWDGVKESSFLLDLYKAFLSDKQWTDEFVRERRGEYLCSRVNQFEAWRLFFQHRKFGVKERGEFEQFLKEAKRDSSLREQIVPWLKKQEELAQFLPLFEKKEEQKEKVLVVEKPVVKKKIEPPKEKPTLTGRQKRLYLKEKNRVLELAEQEGTSSISSLERLHKIDPDDTDLLLALGLKYIDVLVQEVQGDVWSLLQAERFQKRINFVETAIEKTDRESPSLRKWNLVSGLGGLRLLLYRYTNSGIFLFKSMEAFEQGMQVLQDFEQMIERTIAEKFSSNDPSVSQEEVIFLMNKITSFQAFGRGLIDLYKNDKNPSRLHRAVEVLKEAFDADLLHAKVFHAYFSIKPILGNLREALFTLAQLAQDQDKVEEKEKFLKQLNEFYDQGRDFNSRIAKAMSEGEHFALLDKSLEPTLSQQTQGIQADEDRAAFVEEDSDPERKKA
ncbi:MAG: hypothetical protein KGJ02_03600 [Verrucomicrobiota bacterium]|nr:hypothetical protein [Verrucomicrobiota bacterium]